MDRDLLNYFRALSEFREMVDEERYLIKVIREAEKSLSIDELGELSQYMRIIIRKIALLKTKIDEYKEILSRFKPRYRELLEKLRDKLDMYLHGGMTISLLAKGGEIQRKASDWNEIISLYSQLQRELNELKIVLEELASDERISSIIESEINEIESILEIYKSHEKIISPPIQDIKNAWQFIGYSVYRGEEHLGYIQGVYLTLPSLDVVLRIIKEEPVKLALLKTIHAKLYENLMTSTSFEEFRDEILNTIIQSLQVNEVDSLRPSLIKYYLEVNFKELPEDIKRLLRTNLENIGYISLKDVIHVDRKENKIDIGTDPVKEIGKLFYAPDISSGKEIEYDKILVTSDDNLYTLYHQTWLPLLGNSAILLIRDSEGLPVPNKEFVKKILLYLETKSFKKKEIGLKKAESEDLYWRLRVLIMRSLSNIPSLTEKRALQPKFVFEFTLKKRIPLTYSEIYESYFAAIPISYISQLGDKYVPKVPTRLIPLSAIISNKTINMILTEEECPVFLGAGIKKKEGLVIECCDKLSDDVIKEISKKFNISSDVIEDVSQNDVKKLIRFLIVSGKIPSRKEYDTLTSILNKKEIRYDELIDKLDNKELQILRVSLAYRIKSM